MMKRATECQSENFTEEEKSKLEPYFTNTDAPVFGIYNLPEVVKGALFARYSRSNKSIRRLFLDEFINGDALVSESVKTDAGGERGRRLYTKVFDQFGDDSIAQLGSAHIACEGVSNLLTKILEWGRLGAYLEQSTRYVFYDQKVNDQYRYFVPPEIAESDLNEEFVSVMDECFSTYSRLVRAKLDDLINNTVKPDDTSDFVWRSTNKAKACDIARGLLPAATRSNVGIFMTGQSFEAMLLRMLAHPLREANDCAEMILNEMEKMIPSFIKRVRIPNRGGNWIKYFQDTATDMRKISLRFASKSPLNVDLVEWDPDAELNIATAAAYPYSGCNYAELKAQIKMSPEEVIDDIFAAYNGDRKNRRHKPGRGFELAFYIFCIVCTYAAFRDLHRHRMLTIQWQDLCTHHGFVTPKGLPPEFTDAWNEMMKKTKDLFHKILRTLGPDVAQYCVPFAYKIRFMVNINARAAMHMLELRTIPSGHPEYRKICQEMHLLIRDKAGHHRIADAMQFVNHDGDEKGRLDAERASEKKRSGNLCESKDAEFDAD